MFGIKCRLSNSINIILIKRGVIVQKVSVLCSTIGLEPVVFWMPLSAATATPLVSGQILPFHPTAVHVNYFFFASFSLLFFSYLFLGNTACF